MEARFENRFVRDENTAKEIYGYWFFKKPASVAIYAFLGYYAFACIFGLIVDFQGAKETLPVLVMIAVYIAVMIIAYRSQIKTMINRDREMAKGGELVCEVSVNDSEFTVSSLESNTSILMENAKYAFLTDNYIAVITKAKLMLILKKDSFTLGDTESFIKFLKEKGIKIKGKKS